MRVSLTIAVIATLMVLSVCEAGRCKLNSDQKMEQAISDYTDTCTAAGFQSTIGCPYTAVSMPGREVKRCRRLEAKLAACDYVCDTATDPPTTTPSEPTTTRHVEPTTLRSTGWQPTKLTEPPNRVDVLAILRSGPHVVRIIKESGVGGGFALSAHSDARNSNSVWALAHRQRAGDDDEYWNLIPNGEKCFKLEKARKRNVGYMLTAHSDQAGDTSVRALIHKPLDVPDECWELRNHSENRFSIIKSMNRNVGLLLTCGAERNSDSFWVDVERYTYDFIWKIEISD